MVICQIVGIIYPPPEIRNIVDKTASFVARNGFEFEARIKANEAGNAKFNFLNPTDPYHAYYQSKVKVPPPPFPPPLGYRLPTSGAVTGLPRGEGPGAVIPGHGGLRRRLGTPRPHQNTGGRQGCRGSLLPSPSQPPPPLLWPSGCPQGAPGRLRVLRGPCHHQLLRLVSPLTSSRLIGKKALWLEGPDPADGSVRGAERAAVPDGADGAGGSELPV